MKRNLLLQRDFLIFDPWDAIRTTITQDIVPHPEMISFRKTSGFGMTLSVYGIIGTSDLTGEKTVEDMVVECGGEDISNGLPESFLQELVNECIEDA